MLQTLVGRMQTKPSDQYQNQQDGRRRGRLDARRGDCLDAVRRRRGRLDARRRGCVDAVRRRRSRLDDEDDGAEAASTPAAEAL